MRFPARCLLALLPALGVVSAVTADDASTRAARAPLAREGDRLTLGGSPIRLVGYGDYGILAESSFDYEAFLSRVVRDGANLVRVWVPYHWANDLAPFAKVPGTVPSYRILQPNPALYTRLGALAKAAERRDVVLQVTLFDAVMLENTSANRWNWSPYRDLRNQDARFIADSTRKTDYIKAGATDPLWRDVHRPMIARVVDAVGDRRNVIYEVMNEPTTHGLDEARVTAFHQRVVEALQREFAAHAGSRVISVNIDRQTGSLATWALHPSSPVDLVSFHIASTQRAGEVAALKSTRPVIVSNDGDVSQWTYAQCPPGTASNLVKGPARAARTDDLLRRTFAAESRLGQRHFEFLDKGLNGSTWNSGTTERPPNYAPSAARLDGAVLDVLRRYSR